MLCLIINVSFLKIFIVSIFVSPKNFIFVSDNQPEKRITYLVHSYSLIQPELDAPQVIIILPDDSLAAEVYYQADYLKQYSNFQCRPLFQTKERKLHIPSFLFHFILLHIIYSTYIFRRNNQWTSNYRYCTTHKPLPDEWKVRLFTSPFCNYWWTRVMHRKQFLVQSHEVYLSTTSFTYSDSSFCRYY